MKNLNSNSNNWNSNIMWPNHTSWKVSKYGVFPGPYFPTFSSISPYSIRMWENTDQKKLRIWTLFTQCMFRFTESKRVIQSLFYMQTICTHVFFVQMKFPFHMQFTHSESDFSFLYTVFSLKWEHEFNVTFSSDETALKSFIGLMNRNYI